MAVVTFANGDTHNVSIDIVDVIRGIDADGDLVIATELPADASGAYLVALTPCCYASGKGSGASPTGVVCRACYHAVDAKFGGRAVVASAPMCGHLALCANDAVGTVDSPVFGPFPTCQRCADHVGIGDNITHYNTQGV